MALRDQPYLPLYVQDFMTDEKLIECSAAATGVYIRLMCMMHKSEAYGKILLKQKDKQTGKPLSDFALKITKHLPYQKQEIETALDELVSEGVLTIDGDCLYQKRMVNDCNLSCKRACAGKKGGKNKPADASQLAKAKVIANTENENEYENIDKKREKEGVAGGTVLTATPDVAPDVAPPQSAAVEVEGQAVGCRNTSEAIFEDFRRLYPGTKLGHGKEYDTLQKHRDWREALPKLRPALEAEMRWREAANLAGEFCPEWPHLRTWLSQRRWEQELKPIGYEAGKNPKGRSAIASADSKYGSTVPAKLDIVAEARELDRRRAQGKV